MERQGRSKLAQVAVAVAAERRTRSAARSQAQDLGATIMPDYEICSMKEVSQSVAVHGMQVQPLSFANHLYCCCACRFLQAIGAALIGRQFAVTQHFSTAFVPETVTAVAYNPPGCHGGGKIILGLCLGKTGDEVFIISTCK
jgi:hypothetical protein